MAQFRPDGLGWVPDRPDFRDLNYDSKKVCELLPRIASAEKTATVTGRSEIDLPREAHDQGALQSSCAFACVSLIEYGERLAKRRSTQNRSRLFVYSMARRVDGQCGDSGASIRSTLKAIRRFGAPPEQLWPYDPARVNEEPHPPAIYAYNRDFASLNYFRLDRRSHSGQQTLDVVRSFLDAQYPIVFGFALPTSVSTESPDIDFNLTQDGTIGGQVVLATGYDNNRKMASGIPGALQIQHSWGNRWGDQEGTGWLSYRFILQGFAHDFWTAVTPAWLAAGVFESLSVPDY
ncbi:MAG: C1 family peptidase [Planctomycetota bacterium]